MRRNTATERLLELLGNVTAGGVYVDEIDEIFVFGSYARGAEWVNDIDLAVEYTPSDALEEKRLRDLWSHRSEYIDFRRDWRGNRRCFEIQFNQAEQLRAEEGFELHSIFRCGDTFEEAQSKLEALRRDPCAAGPIARDGVFPEIAGRHPSHRARPKERIRGLRCLRFRLG